MTIVVNDKNRIHFQFEGERGAFVILHHGLFGSHRDWFEAGYVKALAEDFRLIVPDARGHGRSDRPEEKSAYNLAGMADDLVAVLDWLDIRNAHFVGYSLGALVGFDMLRRHPERVRMVMIGGEAPFPTEEGQALWREALASIQSGSLESWVDGEKEAGRLVRHDPVDPEIEDGAAPVLLEALAEWEIPEQDNLPVRSPITLFSGASDGAAERIEASAKRIPRANFLSFPDLSHGAAFEAGDVLLEAINKFLRTSTQGEERAGNGRQDSRRGSRRRSRDKDQAAEKAPEESTAGAPERDAGTTDEAMQDGGKASDNGETREQAFEESRSAPAGDGTADGTKEDAGNEKEN